MESLAYANYPFMPTHENLTYDKTPILIPSLALPRDYGRLQI